MRTLRALLVFALFLQFVASAPSAVDPSKCVAIWTFTLSCAEPVTDLVKQVKTWSTNRCRDGPEKCMYQIQKESPKELEVKHTSPQTGKITNIRFVFGSAATKDFCKIMAISTTSSQNSTRPNDYCLLYNLIDVSRLTQAQGYNEICNERMCPSKSSADCVVHT